MRSAWDTLEVKVNRPVGRVHCDVDWQLHPGWSDRLRDLDLWYVWAGQGVMQTRDQLVKLRPGVCFLMRPGGRYESRQNPDNPLGVTFIHFDLIDKAGRRLSQHQQSLPGEVHVFDDVNYATMVTGRIVDLLDESSALVPKSDRISQADQSVASALLRGVLMDLDAREDRATATKLSGTQRHHVQMIRKVLAALHQDHTRPEAVSTLAREAGYSPDHFARVFKAVLGQTPRDYLVQHRINRACQLLTESSLSVSQVAASLDYEDVYFFSRQFKQKTGLTPTAFRNAR